MDPSDDAARNEALQRLQSAEGLSDAAQALVAAALSGSGDLDDVLAQLPDSVAKPGEIAGTVVAASVSQIFLSRISVSSLRGIAEPVGLPLTPRVGLVLVCGRNGSGKSSLAEGAEIAVTGTSYRVQQTAWWKDGLQNLHRDDQLPHTDIDAFVDGIGTITVTADLANAQLPAIRQATVIDSGDPFDLAAHGWTDAATRYRPILTYSELANLANAKPKDLSDSIHNIIGLDGLTSADKLLTDAITEHSRLPKTADTKRKTLNTVLTASADSRAAELEKALKPRGLDLDLARSIVAGTTGSAAERRTTLESWTTIQAPSPEMAAEASATLADAIADHGTANASASGRASQLATILQTVLAHREHDTDRCPVCGEGTLDDAWRRDAEQRLQQAKQASQAVTRAESALRAARTAARALLTPLPRALTIAAIDGADPTAANTAWTAMLTLTDQTDEQLRINLESLVQATHDALTALAVDATTALDDDNTQWAPIAQQAADTISALTAAEPEKARVQLLNEAREWFRQLLENLRDERFQEFKDQATNIWTGLRQDSNVTLANLDLKGSNTSRRVDINLAVDDTPAPSAVLSQGELAALGLALFLPRSTADASPFRFVIIDDPVQSMDPTKVDGLARVLYEFAPQRQIIVFTHDDRLLGALRRLGLQHTAYSLTRGRRSAVHIELVADAADQYLRDADALAKDTADLPNDLIAVTVSGNCRDAIDTVATELALTRLRSNGTTTADAEAAIEHAQATTKRLLALALLGDANKAGRPLDAALKRVSSSALDTVNACVEVVHEPEPDRIKTLVADTRQLLADLRDTAAGSGPA